MGSCWDRVVRRVAFITAQGAGFAWRLSTGGQPACDGACLVRLTRPRRAGSTNRSRPAHPYGSAAFRLPGDDLVPPPRPLRFAMTATTGRPLKVGIQLPEVEREVRWPELLDMTRAIEDLGFDSVWVGEHLLYRWEDRPARGPWEAWTLLAAIAASTSRIELGPLVACTNFHNPALLAKQAVTIDELSGGRFVLGLGAGWNETEFRAYGYPYDHRIDRFEEAFTIIRTLLREGAIDFDGRWYQARDCELLPRGPRPAGPPLMIGSNGPRMLRATMAHADAWNSWYNDLGNRPGRRRAAARQGRRGLPRGRARPGRGRAHGRGPGPAARRDRTPPGRSRTGPDAAGQQRARRARRDPARLRRRGHRTRPAGRRPDHQAVDRGARSGPGNPRRQRR